MCSVDHRLAGRQRLKLEELAGEVFADFPAGTPGRSQSDLAFDAAGLSRDVAFEAMAAELILGIVERSLAVALLPPDLVPVGRGLVAVPVVDGPRRVEYLAWRGFNESRAAGSFLAAVGRHLTGRQSAPGPRT